MTKTYPELPGLSTKRYAELELRCSHLEEALRNLLDAVENWHDDAGRWPEVIEDAKKALAPHEPRVIAEATPRVPTLVSPDIGVFVARGVPCPSCRATFTIELRKGESS